MERGEHGADAFAADDRASRTTAADKSPPAYFLRRRRTDLRYVADWSFVLDLQILGKTCSAVVKGCGAE
jgi:lipopolysaccharide/colanic/teichoic acid biosynthesis glycosyltransferase